MNDINDMNGTNKYTSMLCNSIQAAVNECIEHGRGRNISLYGYYVCADWAENENDIEITISVDGKTLMFTEHNVADHIY